LISLASVAARNDLVQICRPTMVKLNHECGETIVFSTPGSDKAVVVDQVAGVHRLIAVTAVGRSLPLHASASGKALMAGLASQDRDELQRRCRLTPFTSHTITDWNVLDAELAEIRRSGIAYDYEECFLGIRALARSIRGPGGHVGAISIVVPSERFETAKHRLTDLLRRRSDAIQRRFFSAPGGVTARAWGGLQASV
jgi:IclR family transcriptional regulator, acetate operon repressor